MKDINLVDKSHLIESNTIDNTKKTEEFLDTLKNIRFNVNDVSGISVDKLDITGFNVDQDIVDKLKKGITPTKNEIASGEADEYLWGYFLYKQVIGTEKPTIDKLFRDNGINDILRAYNGLTTSLEIVGDGETESFSLQNGSNVIDKTNIRNIIYANELSDYVIPFADQRDGGPFTKREECIIPMLLPPIKSDRVHITASDSLSGGCYVGTDFMPMFTIFDLFDIVDPTRSFPTYDSDSTIFMNITVEPVNADEYNRISTISFNLVVDRRGNVELSNVTVDGTPSSVFYLLSRPTDNDTRRVSILLTSMYWSEYRYCNIIYSYASVSGRATVKMLKKHNLCTLFKLSCEWDGDVDQPGFETRNSKLFVNADNLDVILNTTAINGFPDSEYATDLLKTFSNEIINNNFYHVGGNRNAR